MSDLETPSVVVHYAQLIASHFANPHNHVTRVAAVDKDYVPAIVRALEQWSNNFKVVRVEQSIGAALSSFATAEHKFRAPNGREWVADTSAGARCADTPEGWMESLQHITAGYPQTVVIVVDATVLDPKFFELYTAQCSDSRLVIVA